MKKNQKYVVQCIRGNNNKFGFGCRHRKGQYVTYDGKGTNNLNAAHIYINNIDEGCPLLEDFLDWDEYYIFVPVKVIKLQNGG